VVKELVDQGYVAHVWLGVTGQNLDQAAAGYFGLRNTRGMLVTEVFEHSPARAAGLRLGDVILAVDQVPIDDKEHYLDILRNYTSGQRPTLTVLRDNERRDIRVDLTPFTEDHAKELAWLRWGLALDHEPASGALRVASVRQGGPARTLGLEPGDRVRKIAGYTVSSYADFARAFQRYRMNGRVLMLVERGGRGYYVKLRI
jgi:S1-C subfamily serine protease